MHTSMQTRQAQTLFAQPRMAQAAMVSRASRGRMLVVMKYAQRAEYIWCDGHEGDEEKGLLFNEMRAKTKVIQKPVTSFVAEDFPSWSYDGSSTGQAQGNNSDCILNPVAVYPDPIRGGDDVLVMCEVLRPDSTPHETNTRAPLKALCTPEVMAHNPLYGFEQEYTMLAKGSNGYPLGWPVGGFPPSPQGPYYCGVGAEAVYGRPLAEAHMDACIKAGLIISGINAEVMPGQWEFQIGPVGPLDLGDQVMVARYLLNRLGEEMDTVITLHPKPLKGDWNGAGAHTNFSTKGMMADGGMDVIFAAIEKLSKTHGEHITQYGKCNEARLTGKHETCDINTFRSGVADRGASIRIPLPVQLANKGYLEDRRPSANVDPYTVARLLIKTILS